MSVIFIMILRFIECIQVESLFHESFCMQFVSLLLFDNVLILISAT